MVQPAGARAGVAARAGGVPGLRESLAMSEEPEPAHDILAAEAFEVPAADPELHHGPVVLPDDPTGIAEPHDVLAAEEFPMPAVPHSSSLAGLAGGARSSAGLVALLATTLALLLLRRRRRR